MSTGRRAALGPGRVARVPAKSGREPVRRGGASGDNGGNTTRGARVVPGGVPVRTHYAVTRRRGEEPPDLLRLDAGSGEKATPVFLSGWSAHNFVFSNGLEREWRVRGYSPDELASLLVAPRAGVDWVLFDPPSPPGPTDAPTTLTHRENFLEYLLAYPRPSRPDPSLGETTERDAREPANARTPGRGPNAR